jgi:hypothetical protein
MSIVTLLVVILLVVLILGAAGHSRGSIDFAWPGGILGTVLLILLILILLGYR